MDMSKYRELYLGEAREHLARFDEELSTLLQHPDDEKVIQELFRRAHSLKGMSATMGYRRVAEIAHGVENVLERLKRREVPFTTEIFDAVARAMDGLSALIGCVERGEPHPEDISAWLAPLASGLHEPASPSATSSLAGADGSGRDARSEDRITPLRVEVRFSDDTPLPGARAAVTIKRLREHGSLRECEPDPSELGWTDFHGRLSALLDATCVPETIIDDISRIADVVSVEVSPVATREVRATEPSPVLNAPDASADLPSESAKPLPVSRTSDPAAGQTLRIRTDSLDRFMEGVGEMIVHSGRLGRLIDPVADPSTREQMDKLKKVVDGLFREVMGMRMVPFDTIAHRFVRSVRDLSRELGRPVTLSFSGREVRLDRAMLDELVDPINHIVRNCVGHGIEDTAERARAGKPTIGSIEISLVRRGDGVTIRIRDDGRGMDPIRIRRRAVEQGLISPVQAEALSEAEALLLTALPGFSTASSVTELSGRGVGMDVVRTKVDSLGGKLSIQSTPGEGSSFELRLPVTLAIIRAFLIESAGRVWAVPVGSVRRTVEVVPAAVRWAGEGPVLLLDDKTIELESLSSMLAGTEPAVAFSAFSSPRPALVVSSENRTLGFVVDSVLGQQDILVRPLRSPLDEMQEYSGATVLEDGRVTLILDLVNLVTTRKELVH